MDARAAHYFLTSGSLVNYTFRFREGYRFTQNHRVMKLGSP